MLLVGLAAPLVVSPGHAESVTAPVGLQAELLAKVAEYDRNFGARAGDRARVLLVTQPTNADSVTVAQQMSSALGRLSQIAGLPHDETILPYPGAAELARICRDRHVSSSTSARASGTTSATSARLSWASTFSASPACPTT